AVEVTSGSTVVGGRRTRVVDTPGAASFLPASDDERVTRDILLAEQARTVIAVGDAKNLERALLLAFQLAEMEIPHLLCLNMMDEADERGIHVDTGTLAERLGVAVVPTVAVRREGIAGLLAALERPRTGRAAVAYPPAVERALAAIAPLLPEAPIAGRALGLMVLAGD